MLKLLFIDDEPSTLEPLLRFFDRKRNERVIDYCHEVCPFSKAEEWIVSMRPHIVVLDLLLGGDKSEGCKTCDFIWEKHFCPIVVYSARPDCLGTAYSKHPFIEQVTKGRGSPIKTFKAVRKFVFHIEALQKAENDVRQSLSRTMRDLAPVVFRNSKAEARVNIIRRAGRRRLAAMLDKPTADDETLASWEHYLFPPVGEDLQLGDILQDKKKSKKHPASFRVVLTPSCDLVASGGRKPKTDKALAARCVTMKTALVLAGLPNRSASKIKRYLCSTMLTQGYRIPVIPFPKLNGIVPTMATSLRDLELIPLKNIGDNRKYQRVASVDSPFREMVAWAYLQTTGRPALPDRDLKEWVDEIATSVTNEENGAA